MPKCNSRHTETTKVPLMERERHPHKSGQEYEYGETPETGLGGAGVGADPANQCAHHSDETSTEIAREDRPETDTRQGGGGSENNGFARDRDDMSKGGRRAQYDDQNGKPAIKGQHGVPPEVEHDR